MRISDWSSDVCSSDLDAQVGTQLPDARDEVEPVLVRHHHVGDDEVALAFLHPLPQRGRVDGGAHHVTLAAERLGQHSADSAVVVSDEDCAAAHARFFFSSGASARAIGRINRHTVRSCVLSTSTTPPLLPTDLEYT